MSTAKARSFQSINPATNKSLLQDPVEFDSRELLTQKIQQGFEAFKSYKSISIQEKVARYLRYADVLESQVEKIGSTITKEIGKPIIQARGEVKRTAFHYRFYASHAEEFIIPKHVKTEAERSYTVLEPLGVVYIIIPFNFPFWLAFKAAAAYMLIGNAVIVRGSDSTPQTTLLMKECMTQAGFGDEFQITFSKAEDLDFILSNPKIRGVSFTGSSAAGSVIASTAGKYLKKCVMELGGSDPFIVLDDAKVEFAVDIALKSRLANAGQVCNSSKRFLISAQLFDKFRDILIDRLRQVTIGDPFEESTQLGPIARKDLLLNLQRQIDTVVNDKTAQLLYGNSKPLGLSEELQEGNFILPTVLETQNLQSLVMNEETFGPLFVLYKIQSSQEAIQIANDSQYGLGGVVISSDTVQAEKLARELECGMAFVNQISMSDTRCSSGGVKRSGYGRECGQWGCHEFANIKTVWIEDQK